MSIRDRMEARLRGEVTERPGWDEYFMAMAVLASDRGTCDRLRVGAVLARGNNFVMSGYNGAPSKLPHCDEVGHLMEGGHCVRTVHAEANAVALAARRGAATDGATLYVEWLPCVRCANLLINAGVVRVVYEKVYKNSGDSESLFRAAEVELVQFDADSS